MSARMISYVARHLALLTPISVARAQKKTTPMLPVDRRQYHGTCGETCCCKRVQFVHFKRKANKPVRQLKGRDPL